MSYIVLTVISAVFLAMYDLFKKISTREKKDIYEILFFYTSIAFICSLAYVQKAFDINIKYFGYTFVKAGVISLSWFLTMKAVSKLDLGIVVPFSMLGSIFTTVLAWVIYGQKIGIVQIGGSFIILLGLVLLARLNKNDYNGKKDYRYLFLLVIASLLSSISAIIDKKVLSNNVEKGFVLFWFFFFLMVIYLIICLIKNKRIEFKNFKTNLWVIGIGVSIFLADLFYYGAVAIDNVSLSIISIIRKLSVFIGVVLASLFLKEDNLLKKVTILCLMFGGLALILFV